MEYFTNQPQWSLHPPPNSHSPPAENGQQSVQAQPTSTIDPAAYNFGDLSVPPTTQPGYNWFAPSYYPYPNQSDYNLPVTSYSSLNGATSIPSTQTQVAIDPSLTAPPSQLQNGNNVSNYPTYHQTGGQLEPVLAINPSALQNPPTSSPHQSSPIASTSRSIPKTPVRDVLKPLLTASRLSGPSAVAVIVNVLESYGYQDIDCDTRTDFFGKLSVQADDQFFKAWVENPAAIDITRTWLKAGAADKLDGPWRSSINPILSALGRMRFTLESLKNAKLGKIVVKLTKDPNSATRDLSQGLEAKWRRLLEAAPGTQGRPDSADDKLAKKRKLPDSVASKAGPPVKRPAFSVPPPKPVVKREPKVVVTSVKDAKSDSSFFSNKPKAKLPKFTKAPPAPSKTSKSDVAMKVADNVAQPSSFDPFQDALRTMKRTASPKTEVRSGTPQVESRSPVPPTKLGTLKKKKSVTFAPDSQLEQIKWIEKAIYEDDLSIDTMHGMHTLRDLDRDEGAALHAHNILEEQMDWTDVLLVEVTGATLEERGLGSTERTTQEERETSALSAVYMFPSQIPESPAEPPQPAPDDPDVECKEMMLGDEVEGLSNEQPASAASISELLASLPSHMPGLEIGAQAASNPGMALQAMGTPDVAMISNFLQTMQHQSNLTPLMQQFTPLATDMPGYGSQQQQFYQSEDGTGNGMVDTGWTAGRGNNGRGFRGKRRLCNFFAQGWCKYGDNCDFSHDRSSA